MHSFNNFSSFEKPIEKKAKQQAKNKGGGGTYWVPVMCWIKNSLGPQVEKMETEANSDKAVT